MRNRKNGVVLVIFLTFVFLSTGCPRAGAEWWKDWWDKQKKELGEIKEKITQGVEKKVAEVLETGNGAGVEIGYYYPALTSINNRLTSIGSFTDMHGGLFPGVTWRYSITPEFQIGYYGGFGGGYIASGMKTGDTFTTEATTNFIYHAGIIAWKPRISNKFRMFFGVAIGPMFVTYKEDSGFRPTTQNREVKEWTGAGIGYLPFIGFQYKPNFLVGIGFDYGYMLGTIPGADMRHRAGTPYFESSPDIELSGSFAKLGIQLHY